jgi:hypothetical protein
MRGPPRPMRFVASLAAPTVLRLPSAGPWSRRGWPAGKAATYAHTGTAVAFIISELPGERAEALFIANGSVCAHGGRAFRNSIWQGRRTGAPGDAHLFRQDTP